MSFIYISIFQKEAKSLFGAPDAPRTVMEALQQRLEKYKQTEEEAKSKGESSKARRHGRVVKVRYIKKMFVKMH